MSTTNYQHLGVDVQFFGNLTLRSTRLLDEFNCMLLELLGESPSLSHDTLLVPDHARAEITGETATTVRVEAGVRPSMGSVGDCYDNAMCESFFAKLA